MIEHFMLRCYLSKIQKLWGFFYISKRAVFVMRSTDMDPRTYFCALTKHGIMLNQPFANISLLTTSYKHKLPLSAHTTKLYFTSQKYCATCFGTNDYSSATNCKTLLSTPSTKPTMIQPRILVKTNAWKQVSLYKFWYGYTISKFKLHVCYIIRSEINIH